MLQEVYNDTNGAEEQCCQLKIFNGGRIISQKTVDNGISTPIHSFYSIIQGV